MEQQLLLKLLWIPSEPTRMNMLRMFLQGPGPNQAEKLSPVTFLEAIAYHAKLTKIIQNNIPGKQGIAQQEVIMIRTAIYLWFYWCYLRLFKTKEPCIPI